MEADHRRSGMYRNRPQSQQGLSEGESFRTISSTDLTEDEIDVAPFVDKRLLLTTMDSRPSRLFLFDRDYSESSSDDDSSMSDESEDDLRGRIWADQLIANIPAYQMCILPSKATDSIRDFCTIVIRDEGLQMFIVTLICLNSLMMGFSTFDIVEENENLRVAIFKVDKSFLIIFTIELALNFGVHGLYLFSDPWLVFDLVIVVTSWSLESMQVFRTLRLRSFRIFRAFRLATRMPILKKILQAIFDVLPSISVIISLLALIIYIYGVMCTVLYQDLYKNGVTEDNFFSRLDASLFTLFQMVTLDWAKVVRQVMIAQYSSWIVFSSFLTFTSFVLYSLIVAVVCDAMQSVENVDARIEKENYAIEKVETQERVNEMRKKIERLIKQQKDVVELIRDVMEGLDNGEKAHSFKKAFMRLNKSNGLSRAASKTALRQLESFTESSMGLSNKTSKRSLSSVAAVVRASLRRSAAISSRTMDSSDSSRRKTLAGKYSDKWAMAVDANKQRGVLMMSSMDTANSTIDAFSGHDRTRRKSQKSLRSHDDLHDNGELPTLHESCGNLDESLSSCHSSLGNSDSKLGNQSKQVSKSAERQPSEDWWKASGFFETLEEFERSFRQIPEDYSKRADSNNKGKPD